MKAKMVIIMTYELIKEPQFKYMSSAGSEAFYGHPLVKATNCCTLTIKGIAIC